VVRAKLGWSREGGRARARARAREKERERERERQEKETERDRAGGCSYDCVSAGKCCRSSNGAQTAGAGSGGR